MNDIKYFDTYFNIIRYTTLKQFLYSLKYTYLLHSEWNVLREYYYFTKKYNKIGRRIVFL